MIDALLLCRARPGIQPEALEEAVRASAQAKAGGLSGAAVRLPGDALPALAHATAADPLLPDLVITLQGTSQDVLARRCSAMLAGLGNHIDRNGTSVLATRRHVILPGDDHIRLFFGLRRLKRLTLAAFHDYWLSQHAELGRRFIPPHSYHQLHADPELSERMAAEMSLNASTLDGVVEVHFPDVPALVAQLSRDEVAKEALTDERNFIDHARSMFWAYRTI